MDLTPKVLTAKAKIDQVGLHQTKKLCVAKEPISTSQKQCKGQENIGKLHI